MPRETQRAIGLDRTRRSPREFDVRSLEFDLEVRKYPRVVKVPKSVLDHMRQKIADVERGVPPRHQVEIEQIGMGAVDQDLRRIEIAVDPRDDARIDPIAEGFASAEDRGKPVRPISRQLRKRSRRGFGPEA